MVRTSYDPSPEHYDNHFIHLTNYSINKYSDKFVANEDPDADDVGAYRTVRVS